MGRVCGWIGLALVLGLGLSGFSLGADARAKKDPVADAFVLPKGMTLRADQQKAFDQMKKTMEPKLREALKSVQDATTDLDKTKAAREVGKIREEIKKQIQTILRIPAPQKDKPKANQSHNKGAYKVIRRHR